MQSKKTRIAVAQMCSTPRVEENLRTIFQMISNASQKKADLIAFPENCLLMGFGKKSFLENKNIIEKMAIPLIHKWAKDFKIAVLLGGVATFESKFKKFYNRLYFINEKGKTLETYDKIHLFDTDVKGDKPYRESDQFLSGKKVKIVQWKKLKIGLSICYDIRFPELYRELAKNGVQVFFIPAAFTVPTGKAHWKALLKSRAIENLSYVFAPAQCGAHENGRKTFGHSCIIEPWGGVLKEKKIGVGLIYSDIDMNQLTKTRRSFPSLKHRKL